MIKVLVSGANGALGVGLCRHLENTKEFEVHKLSRSTLDFESHDNVKRQLKAILERTAPDIVFHLAASFSDDLDVAYSVNVQSTRWLLESVTELNAASRIVVIGSAAEYGAVQEADNPIVETQPLRPVTTYGLTKVWQTHLAQMNARMGADVVVARIFNLDAPGASESLFVGRLRRQIEELKTGKRRQLEFGSLQSVRDYVDVESAVCQLLKISRHGDRGEVYHVASGKPVRMMDFLRRRLLDNGLDIDFLDNVGQQSNRNGPDVPVIYADVSKTRALATGV